MVNGEEPERVQCRANHWYAITLNTWMIKFSIYPLSQTACLLHKLSPIYLRVGDISINGGSH